MINEVYTLPSLRFVGGGVQKINIRLQDKNGVSYEPEADLRMVFSVIHYTNRDYSSPVLSFDSEDGKIEYSGGDMVTITLDPDDTLDFYGKYIYQLTAVYEEDEVVYNDVIGQGLIYALRNIESSTASTRSTAITATRESICYYDGVKYLVELSGVVHDLTYDPTTNSSVTGNYGNLTAGYYKVILDTRKTYTKSDDEPLSRTSDSFALLNSVRPLAYYDGDETMITAEGDVFSKNWGSKYGSGYYIADILVGDIDDAPANLVRFNHNQKYCYCNGSSSFTDTSGNTYALAGVSTLDSGWYVVDFDNHGTKTDLDDNIDTYKPLGTAAVEFAYYDGTNVNLIDKTKDNTIAYSSAKDNGYYFVDTITHGKLQKTDVISLTRPDTETKLCQYVLSGTADSLGKYGKGNISLYDNYLKSDNTLAYITVTGNNDTDFVVAQCKYLLLPAVYYKNGECVQYSNPTIDSIVRYLETGEYFGKFNTQSELNAYISALTQQQIARFVNASYSMGLVDVVTGENYMPEMSTSALNAMFTKDKYYMVNFNTSQTTRTINKSHMVSEWVESGMSNGDGKITTNAGITYKSGDAAMFGNYICVFISADDTKNKPMLYNATYITGSVS